MRNPDQYCPRCGRRWGFSDEVCDGCGFDPVGNEEDDKEYEAARLAWEREKRGA